MLSFKKVTIIGPGLIGGSIGLILKNKFGNKIEITGVGRNLDRLKLAKKINAIDNYSQDIISSVKDRDLIIVATPVEKIVEIIKLILPYVKKDTLITDVGSIKHFIISQLKKVKNKNLNYIGSHPIAGSEKSGIENASLNMFKNSVCVVCFDKKLSTKKYLKKLIFFWQMLGTKVILLDSVVHDKILSATSHFLHIVSYLIAKQINSRKEYLKFTGGAYRDMTRIAKSDIELWSQICSLNHKFITQELDMFIKNLLEIRKVLGNKNKLLKYLSNIKL
jgi:prephenate dehydrogenase